MKRLPPVREGRGKMTFSCYDDRMLVPNWLAFPSNVVGSFWNFLDIKRR